MEVFHLDDFHDLLTTSSRFLKPITKPRQKTKNVRVGAEGRLLEY